MLGARTSRPLRTGGAKSYANAVGIGWTVSFALRAQCGRDVRAPSERQPFAFGKRVWY
jgi:hypothetical protein